MIASVVTCWPYMLEGLCREALLEDDPVALDPFAASALAPACCSRRTLTHVKKSSHVYMGRQQAAQ